MQLAKAIALPAVRKFSYWIQIGLQSQFRVESLGLRGANPLTTTLGLLCYQSSAS